MDKQIIVGGIYEFDLEIYWQRKLEWQHANGFPDARRGGMSMFMPFRSVVVYGHTGDHFYTYTNNEQKLSLNATHPDALGKQIGYDATYSEDYKAGLELLKQCQHFIQCCDDLIEDAGVADVVFVKYLTSKKRDLEWWIEEQQKELETIKAQSWNEVTS